MLKQLLKSLTAAGVALTATSAFAVAITTPGLTLTAGDKTFSNFSCSIQNGIGFFESGAPVTCGGIDVSTFLAPDIGLRFQSNFFVGSANLLDGDGANLDILLGYTVTVNDPAFAIDGISLAFNATQSGLPGASANITETAFNNNLIVGQTAVDRNLVTTDLQDPPYEIFDIPLTGSFRTLSVLKDIGLNAPFGSVIQFSFVDQDFHQRRLPEPGSLLLLSTILGGIGFATRKRQAPKA